MAKRYVYILETGMYDDRGIMKVYRTAEKALAEHPDLIQRNDEEFWTNNERYDDRKELSRWEVG